MHHVCPSIINIYINRSSLPTFQRRRSQCTLVCAFTRWAMCWSGTASSSCQTKHDHHAVHHYTEKTIYVMCKKVIEMRMEARTSMPHVPQEIPVLPGPEMTTVYLFSDGCAAQYKSKGNFADISLMTGRFSIFFVEICIE